MFFTNRNKQELRNIVLSEITVLKNNMDILIRELKEEFKNKIVELNEKLKEFSNRTISFDNNIDKLEKYNIDLSNLISNINKKINETDNNIKQLTLDTNIKLTDFHKEILNNVCSQFFDVLDKIFRTSKEMSLITTLINTNSTELGQLKSQLLKPYIEAKHREERIKQGEVIANKGQKILEDRNALHEEVIQKQREGKDVSRLKIKLEAYNEILEKLKGA